VIGTVKGAAYVELAANVGLEARLEPCHPRQLLSNKGSRVVPVKARKEQVLVDQVAPPETEDLDPRLEHERLEQHLFLPQLT
jgi:hypothetical protein